MHTIYFPCVRKKIIQYDIIWEQWEKWQVIFIMYSGQHTVIILNYNKSIHTIYFP